MNTGKVALSVLAVAATGALVGFLFAPQKGATLRKKIVEMGEKDYDVVKDKFNGIIDIVTQNFEKVKESVFEFANKTLTKSIEKVETV